MKPSGPLDAPLIIGGPGDVTIYLKSTRPEIELTATLFDVAPDGTITKITDGDPASYPHTSGVYNLMMSGGEYGSQKGRGTEPSVYE